MVRRPLSDDVLRSLGHVRAYVDAGDASETIVHALASHNFGRLSERFKKILETLQDGEPFEATLRDELEDTRGHPSERGYGLLLGALLSESGDTEARLASISDEIMDANAHSAATYAKRVQFLSSLGVFLGLGSIFIPLVQTVVTSLSGTPFVEGTIQWDDSTAYIPLLVLFTGLFLIMARWR